MYLFSEFPLFCGVCAFWGLNYLAEVATLYMLFCLHCEVEGAKYVRTVHVTSTVYSSESLPSSLLPHHYMMIQSHSYENLHILVMVQEYGLWNLIMIRNIPKHLIENSTEYEQVRVSQDVLCCEEFVVMRFNC